MNTFHMVHELWASYYMDFKQGELIQKTKLARVVFLVWDTSSQYDLAIHEVSLIYSVSFRNYEPNTKKALHCLDFWQGELIQKPN